MSSLIFLPQGGQPAGSPDPFALPPITLVLKNMNAIAGTDTVIATNNSGRRLFPLAVGIIPTTITTYVSGPATVSWKFGGVSAGSTGGFSALNTVGTGRVVAPTSSACNDGQTIAFTVGAGAASAAAYIFDMFIQFAYID